MIPFSTLPRAAARPARSGTGLALGYYLAAPPGQKDAALRAGRVELVAVSGCARFGGSGAWAGDAGIGLSWGASALASVWLLLLVAGGRRARAQEPGPLPGISPLTASSDLD